MIFSGSKEEEETNFSRQENIDVFDLALFEILDQPLWYKGKGISKAYFQLRLVYYRECPLEKYSFVITMNPQCWP